MKTKHGSKKADAHKNASFAGCGGHGVDSCGGSKGTVGGVVSGSKNVNPPNANAYKSFSGCGGKSKSQV